MRYKNLLLPMAMFASLAVAGCGDDSADVGTADNASEVAAFEKYGRTPSLTLSAAPTTVSSGTSTTLSWSSAGATTCAASGAWTGTLALSGARGVAPRSTSGYTVTCRNSRGRTSRSVSVSVTAAAPAPAPTPTTTPAPVVVLEASAASIVSGTALSLTWSSTNATSCSASGGWSGTKSVSGIASLTPTATASYTLTCTGTGGAGSATTAVTVTAPPATTPPAGTPPVMAGSSACSSAMTGLRTFDVGPGKTYTELTQVPWYTLRAGDVVNIFHRATPYSSKIGLRAQGTAANPVVINGVTDANCNRPVIDAKNAATPTDLAAARYFDPVYSEFLGAVLIHKANSDPWGYKPKFIQIKNLKVTGAHMSNSYTSQAGTTVPYTSGAAGIYAVTVEDLTVENCEVTGNGVGVFVNTKDDAEEEASYRITLRRNLVYGNGEVGSDRRHNLYIQAVRSLYEGNYFGPLIPGALGSTLKDRSSGTIIRFNRIVAGARAIDLVETEGGRTTVAADPLYNDAWVYGNIIESEAGLATNYATNIVHFGGDNGNQSVYPYRNGTLYFYYNTVVTRSSLAQAWRMRVFDMPSADQTVEARGNVFMHYGDSNYQLMNTAGNVRFVGVNWIRSGWVQATEGTTTSVQRVGTLLEGAAPGFVDAAAHDYRPATVAEIADAGEATAPSHLATNWIDWQYAAPAGLLTRAPVNGSFDLGAIERP